MALWTLTGLTEGRATTRWPKDRTADDGQEGVTGLPRFDFARCADGCTACIAACPTGAIAGGAQALQVDYGACIGCQLCVEACPTGAATASGDWAYGAAQRADLVLSERLRSLIEGPAPRRTPGRQFRRSLHVRHVDAGSCNGCESEIQALNNPFYNLHRLGIFFTASPRHADLLLVTGPVTEAMRAPLEAAYEAMPDPKWVMATGSCAVSGALMGGGTTGGAGVAAILPVDMFLPGSPPNPAAIISALLMLLGRLPQKVKGGRHGE